MNFFRLNTTIRISSKSSKFKNQLESLLHEKTSVAQSYGCQVPVQIKIKARSFHYQIMQICTVD